MLQLEASAREAESPKALEFLIVNETRQLLPYGQAFLLSAHGDLYRLEAASSLSVIERNAPFVGWLEQTVRSLAGVDKSRSIQQFDVAACPEPLRDGWREFSLPFAVWCPLTVRGEPPLAGLWLARDRPWADGELTVLKRLCGAYAHALTALVGPRRRRTSRGRRKLFTAVIIAILIGIGFVPVRLSTLAPAEVVAAAPAVVSAPLDGVIAEVLFPPNAPVSTGDAVLRYDDTTLRNQYDVALKRLEVTRAEYHRVSQTAFRDVRSKARMSQLEAQVGLDRAEVEYARELLDRVEVRALKPGLLVYSDPSDWTGRPVKVGERIMEIANPAEVEIRVDVPVEDAIVLELGAEVQVFLEVAPLDPYAAQVTQLSYAAHLTPNDVLAYRVKAGLDGRERPPRLGLKGTAKLYGEKVSLAFFLFRRPLSALRQFFGY